MQFLILFYFLGILFFALPASAKIMPVPFTSQAPFGSWASPYQDFCEEASITMAVHFVWGIPLTAKVADLHMKIIKQYEEVVFGRWKDTSAKETAQILTNLYGFKDISVKEAVSLQDLKREINSGKILLVPVAGRMLKNPYFTPPGPLYHMLVIHGYDDAKNIFITNDPGTRRGNGFEYNQQTLWLAIHDWNGGDVLMGKKTVIAVDK